MNEEPQKPDFVPQEIWDAATPEARMRAAETVKNVLERSRMMNRTQENEPLPQSMSDSTNSELVDWKQIWDAVFERAVENEDAEDISLTEIYDAFVLLALRPRPIQDSYEGYCHFLLRMIKTQIACRILVINNHALRDKMLAVESTGARMNIISTTRLCLKKTQEV